MNQELKILIVRQDRLGDLMMTLPAVNFLRKVFPKAEIDLSCQEMFRELLKGFCLEHRVGLVTSCHRTYDAALFLNGTLKDCWELVARKISIRVGMYSKPWSFFLLNHGLRQKRSQIPKNEAEFNLELAQILAGKLGICENPENPRTLLPIDQTSRARAHQKLTELGLGNLNRFVVFHPGMRGSALNVPVDSYWQLINLWEKRGFRVLISIGPEARDQELKRELLNRRPELPMVSGLNLPELGELFRMAEVVIAPSTGPLHLAHWVGAKTTGLFSPVRAQHPVRWAPWGGKVEPQVLIPEVNCPAKKDCVGPSCQFYNCMERADWKSLLLRAENG